MFSLVLPVYNEEKPLESVLSEAYRAKDLILSEFPEHICEVEIVCVNDGSTDQTEAILEKNRDFIKIFKNPENMGYGKTLQAGMSSAKGSIIGFHDADGTFKTSEFVEMLRAFFKEDLDMVIGKRFSKSDSRMPIIRKIGNKLFSFVLSLLTHKHVEDTASGLRVIKKESYLKLLPLPHGMNFIIGMTTKAIFEELKIKEYAINYLERAGESKLSVIKDGFRFFFAIFSAVRTYSPLTLFGAIGVAILLFGFYLGVSPTYSFISNGGKIYDDQMMRILLVLFLASSGGIFILNGIAANVFSDNIFKSINIKNKSIFTQVIYRPRIYRRIGIAGGILFFFSVLIIFGIVVEVFDEHWAVLSFSFLLGIMGVQMVNVHLLISLVHDYVSDYDHAARR